MLPFCFRFRAFPFRFAFFRPLLFRFRLLSLLFFLSFSSRFRLTAASPMPVLRFRFLRFLPSLRPDFSCLPSGFLYSAFCLFPFILPGFAPTAVPPVLPFCFRFRAFPSLPLSFVRVRSVLTTQPSVLSFPFFPFSPDGGSFGAVRFLSSPTFPLPFDLFPCRSSDFGTQPSAFPFSVRCLASQWLPQRLNLFPFGFRSLPLGFRFRFRLLGFEHLLFRDIRPRLTCVPQRTLI